LTDHSQALPRALARANDRAWQALGVALAGDGFLDQIKVFFASQDDKGVREQVSRFLNGSRLHFEGTPVQFRKACLEEPQRERKAGWLSAQNLPAREMARQTATFRRYADPKGLVDGAEQAAGQVAEQLATDCPKLAELLRQPTPGGRPLLVAAFAYFFRREVETNEELAHGLLFDGLRQLSAAQEQGFAEVGDALATLGERFDQVFEQLGRIETVVSEAQCLSKGIFTNFAVCA
jgi:hypothetical protein